MDRLNSLKLMLSCRMFAAGLLLVASNLCSSQESGASSPTALAPDVLTSRYPPGSIQSSETADRALADVEQQRALLDQQYSAQKRECYAKFFATSCLDAAKAQHRVETAKLRQVEIEANAYIRSARVAERDRHLAERAADNAKNPPKPMAEPQPKAAAAQNEEQKELAAKQRADAHAAKLRKAAPDAAEEAKKRADSVAAYEKKIKDAEDRQRDVAKKKAEKEEKAAAKAAANAASAAASSSTSAATKP